MDQTIHPFSERVLRDMNSAVLVLDGKGCVVYANGPAARMLEMDEGYREERNRFQLVTDQVYNDRFYETILDALYHKDQTLRQKVHPPAFQLLFAGARTGRRAAGDDHER